MFLIQPAEKNGYCSRFAAANLLLFTGLLAAFILGTAFFVSVGLVNAQEAPMPTEPPLGEPPLVDLEPQPPTDESEPTADDITTNVLELGETTTTVAPLQEVILDETVSTQDLGATEARILPDSPFHIVKEFGRGVQEVFTFNPVKKAEVRLEHANQQLSEIKQMIDEDGIENMDQEVLEDAFDYYEHKVDQVKEQADDLKERKGSEPELVNAFLNELTDKQLKQQKLLDGIAKEVIEVKIAAEEEGEVKVEIEQITAIIEETKDIILTDFTDTLVAVENTPEDMANRISQVMEVQTGSEFKELKNLEILEEVMQKVPETAKDAIALAKQNTLERFEISIKTLPPVTRGDTFKNYIEQANADETRLMVLLEEIKKSAGIPQDILSMIEEAKEITVRKLETKLELFENPAVEERFFSDFGDDVPELVAMKEFNNRMRQDFEERMFIEDRHDQNIELFKQRFTDITSQEQAVQFEKLSKQMMKNPTPKTFELMMALEEEVRDDPTKRAFLDEMGSGMKREFELGFRQEGARFMDRIVSLDPRDMATMGEFDFNDSFVDEFASRNAQQFRGYMQDIYVPDKFDDFHERFFDAPDFVINEIKQNDATFQDAMQFKVRKMEEMRIEQEREIARATLDYEEREVWHQLDREQRQKEEKFWNTLNQVSHDDFETRKELWEEKISNDYDRVGMRMEEQKRIFEDRLRLDPWCDAICQEIQRLSFEQELRHEQERLADDLLRERNRIESEQMQFQRDNPLAGICDTPESCEQYCRNNPSSMGCEWMMVQPIEVGCPPPAYWDPGRYECVYPGDFVQCGPGEYWGGDGCVPDPYYRPPTDFIECGYGMHWNDMFGFCEPDYQPGPMPPGPMPPYEFCPPGHYYDDMLGECIPENFQCPPGTRPDFYTKECIADCGPNYYFDFFTNTCEPEWRDCGEFAFWNPGTRSCERDPSRGCPDGDFWDFALGRCVAPGDQPPPPDIGFCPMDWRPVCGYDNKTYTNECHAGKAGMQIKDYHECGMEPPGEACPYGEFFEPMLGRCIPDSAYIPPPSGTCDVGYTFREGFCERVISDCPTFCQPFCTGNSYCMYDNFGCATGCSPECPAEQYYDQYSGSCIGQTMPPPGTGYCGNSFCENYEDRYNCPSDCGGGVICPENIYNDYSGNSVCSSSYCPQGCDYDFEGCPMSCYTGTIGCNHNGICDGGETSAFCPEDCGGAVTCQTNIFNDNTGTSFCNHSYCPNGCIFDAMGCPTGCIEGGQCGDGYCSPAENSYDCPVDCSGGAGCPSNIYNNYTTGYACNFTECPNGCNFDNQGCPFGCYTPGAEMCNYNGVCDGGETQHECPADCGRPAAYCGDYICDPPSEDQWSCSMDCGGGMTCDYDGACEPNNGETGDCTDCNDYCDYDGTCEPPEDQWSCPGDCGGTACDYDGYCDSGEDSASCPGDCGGWGSTCNNNGVCETGETNEGCSSDCTLGVDNTCGNNNCEAGEDTGNCSVDCGGTSTYCGNGYCESYEDSWSCPSDCGGGDGACPSGYHYHSESGGFCMNEQENYSGTCYNSSGTTVITCPSMDGDTCDYDGYCDPDETMASCPSDCGGGDGACPSGYHYHSESGGFCMNEQENYSGTCYNSSGTSVIDCPATTCDYDGYCDPGEDMTNCPGDCGGGCNYNGICDGGETMNDCPEDCGGMGGTCPSTIYNNYTYTYACNYTQCPSGCNFDGQGCPDSCMESGTGWCGDGMCDSGETIGSCPSDCGGGLSCPSTMANDYTSSDVCSYSSCPSGCEFDTQGCPMSCMAACPSNEYNDYTSDYACSWSFCPDGCEFDVDGCPYACMAPAGYCGDGMCDYDEDSGSCPSDCGPPPGWCGDGMCDYDEDSGSCPSDCSGPPPGGWCGDGMCDSGEDPSWCPEDC